MAFPIGTGCRGVDGRSDPSKLVRCASAGGQSRYVAMPRVPPARLGVRLSSRRWHRSRDALSRVTACGSIWSWHRVRLLVRFDRELMTTLSVDADDTLRDPTVTSFGPSVADFGPGRLNLM